MCVNRQFVKNIWVELIHKPHVDVNSFLFFHLLQYLPKDNVFYENLMFVLIKQSCQAKIA